MQQQKKGKKAAESYKRAQMRTHARTYTYIDDKTYTHDSNDS